MFFHTPIFLFFILLKTWKTLKVNSRFFQTKGRKLDSYLETLSGEQAEMLVSMESLLSTLIVSKAWLSRYLKASR